MALDKLQDKLLDHEICLMCEEVKTRNPTITAQFIQKSSTCKGKSNKHGNKNQYNNFGNKNFVGNLQGNRNMQGDILPNNYFN